jgi:hypothetical protein
MRTRLPDLMLLMFQHSSFAIFGNAIDAYKLGDYFANVHTRAAWRRVAEM